MRRTVCLTFLLLASCIGTSQVLANKYHLRDGRTIQGMHVKLSRVDERVNTPDLIGRPIIVIDDGLRHIYMSQLKQILRVSEESLPRHETFRTGRQTLLDGKEYYIPGNYWNAAPFDEFGRRLLEIRHSRGVEFAEQAIVELTPYYISVTGVKAYNNIHINGQPLNWNKRIATNAVPREQISAILTRLIDPQNLEDRLKLVRFYFAGGQYVNADAELEAIVQDWQDSPDAMQRIRPVSLNIRQALYQQILDELEFRWEGGQYHFVRQYITELEQDPKLPERQIVPVRQFLRRYDEIDQQSQDIVTALKELYEQLPEYEKSDKIPPIIAEIERELNFSTIRRLEGFRLFASDPQLSPAEKLALAITGWYAGPDADNIRLSTAITLQETEQLVAEYLRSGQDSLLRQRILEQLRNLETARPDLIAGILATMRPPFADLPEGDATQPGYYNLSIPSPLISAQSSRAAEIRYTVQLPPDYNPYLRYPMVVSLNGLTQTPDMQVDWWAGSWRGDMRIGHATRHGYIIIAPEWNPPEAFLSDYDFSVFSHAAVLAAVKDAFRRFSVNTNKVFISGHGIGGTAAWDIALAHPDLWAGAVIFNAVASKYIDAYASAVRHVPLYLVWGEMEGVGNVRKWNTNAFVLNRYLQSQSLPGDVTAVRYIGRGMEGFSEEILHILEWMGLRQRNPSPTEFKVETLRPWDSFFWWVEMPHLLGDVPRNMVDPMDFPARRNELRPGPVTVESQLHRTTNSITVTTRPRVGNVQIFLTPDIIDFRARASVRVNDRNYHPANGVIEPDIEVMLEDVRTRGDRLHPFWAMLEG
ncbi:MAG: alpha/beta hydrolase-fold protein [Planctomycetaceae bacterium]|nr:alpha/beta hydrolase-fold protein [Planctomycetaceae bacterium]